MAELFGGGRPRTAAQRAFDEGMNMHPCPPPWKSLSAFHTETQALPPALLTVVLLAEMQETAFQDSSSAYMPALRKAEQFDRLGR